MEGNTDCRTFAQSCNTHRKVTNFSYKWTIDGFSKCIGDRLISPEFYVSSDMGKWYVTLDMQITEHYYIFAIDVRPSSSWYRANIKSSILNTQGVKWRTEQCPPDGTFNLRKCWNLEIRVLKKHLLTDLYKGAVSEDKLTILIEASVVTETTHVLVDERTLFKIPETQFTKDIEAIFDSGTFSDLTVAAGEREFKIHKSILVARSTVFEAMFQHEMLENKQNRVNISDIDPDVLEEMLRFIYTDCAPNLNKMAAGLLAAADKYALERLKVICEESLFKNISTETAADTLVLSYLHSADQLKRQTAKYITKNLDKGIAKTTAWQKMMSLYPNIITDLFDTLALK